MGLSYKARRGWSLVILLIGLPVYIIVAVALASLFSLPDQWWWLELIIYIALGVLWVFPFKFIFKGIGQADPDQD